MSDAALSAFMQWLDLLGVFCNGIGGAVVARRARLDVMGLVVLGIMTGLGGGMIRDVLLQAGPPVALVDWRYLTTAIVGASTVSLLGLRGRLWRRIFLVIDALAVGCWSAVGAAKALALDHSWLTAVLLGTITAVGGSFVRDVVLQRIPSILGGNYVYATWAAVGAGLTVLGTQLGYPAVGSVVATVVTGALILVSRRRRWALPQVVDERAPGDALARAWTRRHRRGRGAGPGEAAGEGRTL